MKVAIFWLLVVIVILIGLLALDEKNARQEIHDQVPFEIVQKRFERDLKYKMTPEERTRILSNMLILSITDYDRKGADEEIARIREGRNIYSEAIDLVTKNGTRQLDEAGALYAEKKLQEFLEKKQPTTSPSHY